MTYNFKEERGLVENEFRRILDRLILDPDFKYKVEKVSVIDRLSMTGERTEKVFTINVSTNNRNQLLGQVVPFKKGGYRGYFNNFFSGMIIQKFESVFNPDYYFFIEIDAKPFKHNNLDYVDKHISLDEAIKNGIMSKDSPLVKKMREYNLKYLILAGGTVITGPLSDSITTMERICKEYNIDSVLDVFCGSGGLTKVLFNHGTTRGTCIDLNLTSAKENLKDISSKIDFRETNAFNYKPKREYDLMIGDPYYDIAYDFVDKVLPQYIKKCRYYFMTVGFIDNFYWSDKIINKLKEYFSEIKTFNTGRMNQVLCSN